MSANVYVFLAEGFEEIEAITPIDILRRANCTVTTVSITNNRLVVGAHNIPVVSDALFSECSFSDADALYLPGGLPGADNLNAHDELKQLLCAHFNQGKILSANCAAPLVLGGLGILEGKKATCYPGYEHTLIDAIPTAEACVVADNIITGNGPGASAKIAFALVEKLRGKDTAMQLQQGMMFL
ncbi:MAG TPA: DJ-1/PfpI family protein [Bacteroidales bacterium]|nr:DJ-1/PfpI family protein [Bacteroidales bacterium]